MPERFSVDDLKSDVAEFQPNRPAMDHAPGLEFRHLSFHVVHVNAFQAKSFAALIRLSANISTSAFVL